MTKFISKDERGFTLIELMIVIAIIGILAAIAIPQFSAYRTRSYNSAAQSDVRNIATAMEAYYVDHSSYNAALGDLTGANFGYMQSGTVSAGVSGNQRNYTISAFHGSGNKTYYLSGPGGTIGTTAP